MVSRLDRLFILLESGTNESIRLAAAKQLAEVQKAKPEDINSLLIKIKDYTEKSSWETRVAAGHAVKYVLEQFEPWASRENIVDESLILKYEHCTKLLEEDLELVNIIDKFDIVNNHPDYYPKTSDDIKSKHKKSLPSKQSDSRKNSSKKPACRDNESLQRQRKLINKELGIDMVDRLNLGVKSTDIISNDDLIGNLESDNSQGSSLKNFGDEQNQVPILENYDRICEKLIKLFPESDEKEEQIWPLDTISRNFINNLSHPRWEVRHGSAIALRELIKSQGNIAGRRLDCDSKLNDFLNQLWLIDVALSSLVVLSTDKVGDFLFDQVVAPVRENAAQLLSCTLIHLQDIYVTKIFNIIHRMIQNPSWETRHGAVLAMKYSLNVIKQAVSSNVIESFGYDTLETCLKDSVDDIAAEAAATLTHITDILFKVKSEDQIKNLIDSLWIQLKSLDELHTATVNIILLLTTLLTSSKISFNPKIIYKYLPILWSKINNPSTKVRVSVLNAIAVLLESLPNHCSSWMSNKLLDKAFRLTFQRCLIESSDDVYSYLDKIWGLLIQTDSSNSDIALKQRQAIIEATSTYLNFWICLLMHQNTYALNTSNSMWLKMDDSATSEYFLASCSLNMDSKCDQMYKVTKCRLIGSKLLGCLYSVISEQYKESQKCLEALTYISNMFIHYLKTASATQKSISCWTIENWATYYFSFDESRDNSIVEETLRPHIINALGETTIYYDELMSCFTRLQTEVRDFIEALLNVGINLDTSTLQNDTTNSKKPIYSLQEIDKLCDISIIEEIENIIAKKSSFKVGVRKELLKSKDQISEKLLNLQKGLSTCYLEAKTSQKKLATLTLSSVAYASLAWSLLPKKLEIIINPLMQSIFTEEDASLQAMSVNYLVKLTKFLVDANQEENQATINVIIGQLTEALCQESFLSENDNLSDHRIILVDCINQKLNESNNNTRRNSATNSTKRKFSSGFSSLDVKDATSSSSLTDSNTQLETNQADTKLKGSKLTLKRIAQFYGQDLQNKLPSFWNKLQIFCYDMNEFILYNPTDKQLVEHLRVFEICFLDLHENLKEKFKNATNNFVSLLSRSDSITRHLTSRCLGQLCFAFRDQLIPSIVEKLVPILGRFDCPTSRCGAIETFGAIIEANHLDIIPFSHLLLIPILKTMSDQIESIRLMATHCFGRLLSLFPLSEQLVKHSNQTTDSKANIEDRKQTFLIEELLNPKMMQDYKIPVPIDAKLRSYQQQGINWLAFLNKFNLHGILCDEMGLGKTIMTICIVASDHFNMNSDVENNKEIIDSIQDNTHPPSLIICPPTLVDHWLYEIRKFSPQNQGLLQPLSYVGNVKERTDLRKLINQDTRKSIANINTVIVSYDALRNDIEFFKSLNWNYCILDEGHIIKNSKTKLAKAIKIIKSIHRLVLTGTPIQNNVTELWSLFDFLMPGYLGNESQFNSRYTKPILSSRELKSSATERECGVLALESLHRQVLPFILRRLKKDVLCDLPPKIVQDYICELSPLQLQLYEDFTKSQQRNKLSKKSLQVTGGKLNEKEQSETKGQVFQALKYLKNVCNHPKLVLSSKHPQTAKIKSQLKTMNTNLDDIEHSSKLKALMQLLIDCGLQCSTGSHHVSNSNITANVSVDVDSCCQLLPDSIVNQHRILIFCQLRAMIDIIETDLLKKHMPAVTYLRLDGSIQVSERQSIVNRFNNDPSIDILLLTTQIGGLGLNLTGADTVIFVEHDWNPTRDTQAMDRAHRLGQKKVVNVYRLITKNTIEEKIMSLQKFKTMVSETVISKDNADMSTMQVDSLFDLFDSTTEQSNIVLQQGNLFSKQQQADDTNSSSSTATKKLSTSAVLSLLPDLWDQKDYENEYDLSSFIASLKQE